MSPGDDGTVHAARHGTVAGQPGAGRAVHSHHSLGEPTGFELPPEVASEIDASIVAVDTDRGVERIAHLGNGFTTLVGTEDAGFTAPDATRVEARSIWTSSDRPALLGEFEDRHQPGGRHEVAFVEHRRAGPERVR